MFDRSLDCLTAEPPLSNRLAVQLGKGKKMARRGTVLLSPSLENILTVDRTDQTDGAVSAEPCFWPVNAGGWKKAPIIRNMSDHLKNRSLDSSLVARRQVLLRSGRVRAPKEVAISQALAAGASSEGEIDPRALVRSTSSPDGGGDDWFDTSDSEEQLFGDLDGSIKLEAPKSELSPSQMLYVKCSKSMKMYPIQAIVKGLGSSRICVKHKPLGEKALKSVAVALVNNTCVKSLCLDDVNPENQGMAYIAAMLEENCFISALSFADNSMGSMGAECFKEVLINSKLITHLNLSGNCFGDKDAPVLAEVIKKNIYIVDLDLSHNAFMEVGGQILGEAIAVNENITTLNLSWNHLRMKGASAVCAALGRNTVLVDVNFSWNGLGKEGSDQLKESLAQNSSVERLDLSCNRIDTACLLTVGQGLLQNKTLQSLKVANNPITSDGALCLLKMIESALMLPLLELDLSTLTVDMKFVELSNKIRAEREDLQITHGRISPQKRLESDGEPSKFVQGDPLTILMQYCHIRSFRLRDLFKTLDKDGSKSISHKEFKDGLMQANIPLSPESIDKLVRRLDADGDGEVDFTEMMDGQKEHRRKLGKMRADRNTDYMENLALIDQQIHALLASMTREGRRLLEEAKKKQDADMAVARRMSEDSFSSDAVDSCYDY